METNTTPIINNDNISLLEENIPKDIEKYQIPGWANIIGEKAFANSYLEEITIPGTVKKISSKAFLRCLCLRKVVIEEGVEEIEDEAFDGCTFLTSITLPTTLKYIGDFAFRNCVSLKTIIIPEGVKRMDYNVLGNCCSLEMISFPSSLFIIDDDYSYSSYYYCRNIKNIIIPIDCPVIIKIITDFSKYNKFTQFTIICDSKKEKEEFLNQHENSLANNNLLFINLENELLDEYTYASRRLKEVDRQAYFKESIKVNTINITRIDGTIEMLPISIGVTRINKYLFTDPSSIKEIEIPQGIDTIESSTFANFYNLEKIKLPEYLKKIDDHAFENCDSLKDIIIPDSVTEIGREAFRRCINLTSINIPRSIKNIPVYAFRDCYDLKRVIIPDSCLLIDEILNPEYINEVLELPKNIKILIKKTSSIVDNDNITSKKYDIEYIDNDTIPKVEVDNKPNSLTREDVFKKINESKIEEYVVPKGIESIEKCAFYNCKNLKKIRLPNTLKEIGYMAFARCDKLESITIPEGVKSIKEFAFHECPELRELTIPSTVKIIPMYAFNNCSKLTKLVISEGVEQINMEAITNCNSLKELYLPSTIKTYGKPDKDYYSFQSITSGCYNIEKVGVPINCLSLTKILEDFEYCEIRIIYEQKSEVVAFIQENIESIPNYNKKILFQNKVTKEKTKLENMFLKKDRIPNDPVDYTIPDDIVIVSAKEFYQSKTLKSGKISKSVRYICEEAFSECSNLEKVSIKKGVEIIGTKAFYNDPKLKEINIPSSVRMIGESCFEDCNSLENITFETNNNGSNNLYNIGPYAFRNCQNLKRVVLPNGIKEICKSAFNNCTNLKEIVLPYSLENIGYAAFLSCDSLEEITIPATTLLKESNIITEPKNLKKVIIKYRDYLELNRFITLNNNSIDGFYKKGGYPIEFMGPPLKLLDKMWLNRKLMNKKHIFIGPEIVKQETKRVVNKNDNEVNYEKHTGDEELDKIINKIYFYSSFLSKTTQKKIKEQIEEEKGKYKAAENEYNPIYDSTQKVKPHLYFGTFTQKREKIKRELETIRDNLKPVIKYFEYFKLLDIYEKWIESDNFTVVIADNNFLEQDIQYIIQEANTNLLDYKKEVKEELLKCIQEVRVLIEESLETKKEIEPREELVKRVGRLAEKIKKASENIRKLTYLQTKLHYSENTNPENEKVVEDLFDIKKRLESLKNEDIKLAMWSLFNKTITITNSKINNMLASEKYQDIDYNEIKEWLDKQFLLFPFRAREEVKTINIIDHSEFMQDLTQEKDISKIDLLKEQIENCIKVIEDPYSKRENNYQSIEELILNLYFNIKENDLIPEEIFEARKSEILNCLKKWQTELNNNEKNIDYEDYKEKISKKVADIELNIFKYIGAVNFKNYHL